MIAILSSLIPKIRFNVKVFIDQEIEEYPERIIDDLRCIYDNKISETVNSNGNRTILVIE